MTASRRALVAGVAAALAGFALVAIDAPVPSAGDEVLYLVIVALAVLGALWGGVELAAGRSAEGDRWRPSATERGFRVPVPGERIDPRKAETKDRLRQRAVAALMAERGCSRSAAEDRIDAGEWTDDALAAAYLNPERSLPRRTRLAGLLRRESTSERAFGRAVAALRRLGGERDA